MRGLTEAIDRASALVASGDPDGAAAELLAAVVHVNREADPALLLQYADACHDWGPPEAEEAALRAVVGRGGQLDAVERLLDLLHRKLDSLNGEAREETLLECEHLGSEALRLLPDVRDLRWANLVRPRGLRRLELAQRGRRDRVPAARADLEAYRAWLERNESVPAHMKRPNLIALADIDLAELDLVEGRRVEAARRLESAIAVLEMAKAPKGWIDRAYALLERGDG